MNREETIARLCKLQSEANKVVTNFRAPSDCVCKPETEYFRNDQKGIELLERLLQKEIERRKRPSRWLVKSTAGTYMLTNGASWWSDGSDQDCQFYTKGEAIARMKEWRAFAPNGCTVKLVRIRIKP